jgi:hypothetical protein
MKFLLFAAAMLTVTLAGFTGGSLNRPPSGWLGFQQAEASAYRRSVRRTARRTSRRHAYAYGAAATGAVVVGAVAVGTVVATLPPACSTVIVNGISYHNCAGTYYRPQGTQYIVVQAP